MNSSPESSSFAMQLLRQDSPLSDSEYKDYRMKLENALATAERREKLAGTFVIVSLVLGFSLMVVGGTKICGSFDPGDQDATVLSLGLGVVYVLAIVTFPISLASYFSRFRPKVRDVKEQLREASILALHGEISELRKQIDLLSRRDDNR